MAEIKALGPTDRKDGSAAARLSSAPAWRSLAAGEDAAEAFKAWLSLFCAQVDLTLAGLAGTGDYVREAMVALGQADSDRFSRVAAYGQGATDSLPLAKAAERAMASRRGIVQAGEGAGTSSQIAYPIISEGSLRGVIALELLPAARDHLETVMRLAQWGSAWFNWRFARADRPAADAGSQSADATLQVEALRILATAGTTRSGTEAVATLLADRLGADKVSIGFRKGRSTRLVAVSHGGFAGVINDYLTALLAAMDEAADAGTRVASPLPADQAAVPHAAHDRLCRVHDCDWAETVPVALTWARRTAHVALVAEGKGARPDGFQEKFAAVAEAIAPVLLARLRADQSVTGRAWEFGALRLGRAIGSRPGKALLVVAAAAAAVFLAFAEGEYRIAADSTLEGVVRRSIVAPFDGYIAEARARPGDKVPSGGELGRLDDRDLRLQKLDLEAKVLEVTRQIDEAMGKRDIARVNILGARQEQHQADLTVINENLSRTVLTAPFDAYVVSGDKTQAIGSPVRRGDVLYEISPLETFRVDLDIPQSDFAAAGVGQRGHLLLSSMPYKTFPLHIVRITPLAVSRDGKTVFRAEAALDESDPVIRPGMQGVARIDAGQRRLVWIWTHTAVDWVRIKLWEWLP